MKRFFGVPVLLIPILTLTSVSAQFLETINRGTVTLLKERGKTFLSWRSFKLNTDEQPMGAGIADLDGDSAYDYVIKYPNFKVDPCEQSGYWKRSPEPYRLDAYCPNGNYLWPYNMGWSLETGIWYSPYLDNDMDRDGFAEVNTKAGEGDPRQMDGHVLDGPEYLVKIEGRAY